MVYATVAGAGGRMGQAIIGAMLKDPSLSLSGALERDDSPLIGADAGEPIGIKTGIKVTGARDKALKKSDVLIDFSTPDATIKNLEECAVLKKAIVIGTTGFSHIQRDAIRDHGAKARIVVSPNMSIGINLLLKLVHDASTVLGKDYDVEITEWHHRHKKDAPSGTAVRIAEVIADALKRDLEKSAVYERKGITGERRPEEIGMQSIRAGDIVGDHTVLFGGMGERLELTHRASSRDTFALGALRAALWVVNRPNGIYDMQDVLGLKKTP
jgi:4-hydroxy-tetrahydrodipicolinate reductase